MRAISRTSLQPSRTPLQRLQLRLLASRTRLSPKPHLPLKATTTAALATAALATSLCAFTAPAEAASPWWHITSSVRPTNLPPGSEGTVSVQAINLGNQPTSGKIELSDILPAGLKVAEEEVNGKGRFIPKLRFMAFYSAAGANLAPYLCSVSGQRVSCQTEPPTQAGYEVFIEKFLSEPPFNGPPFTEPPLNEPPFPELFKEGLEAEHPKSEFEEQFTIAPL